MLSMIRRVLWRMLLTTAAIAALGALIGYLIAGLAGVWGSLLAAGIGLFFTGTTVLLIYLVVGRGPELLQLVLLGGWILKMAVVFVLLLWLRQLDFYHRGVFVGAIVVLAMALLIVELLTVLNARIPAVDPSLRPDAHSDIEPDGDTDESGRAERPDQKPGRGGQGHEQAGVYR